MIQNNNAFFILLDLIGAPDWNSLNHIQVCNLSTAAISPTVASSKLLRSFNEDCSLEWLETEADATPATKRAMAANFMLAEWLGEQKQILKIFNGKPWITSIVAGTNGNRKGNLDWTHNKHFTYPKEETMVWFVTLLHLIGAPDCKSLNHTQACSRQVECSASLPCS